MIKDHNLQMGDVQEFITSCLLNVPILCNSLMDILQKRKNILKLICVLNYFDLSNMYLQKFDRKKLTNNYINVKN